MNKNKDKKVKVLLNELRELPDELQRAAIWAIEHWSLVECICKDPEITDEEIEKLKTTANETNDHLLFVLACATQVFKHQNDTDSRTDDPDIPSQ